MDRGQPVLIIHGNGGSINNFAYQIPYFSSKYKVILADSRAQGRSADNGDSLSYEMMADDYAALLDSLKIDSACIIRLERWRHQRIIAGHTTSPKSKETGNHRRQPVARFHCRLP